MNINDLKNAIRMVVGALIGMGIAHWLDLNMVWATMGGSFLVLCAQGRNYSEQFLVQFLSMIGFAVTVTITMLLGGYFWWELLAICALGFVLLSIVRWRPDLFFASMAIAAISFWSLDLHNTATLSANYLSLFIGYIIALIITLLILPNKAYTKIPELTNPIVVYVGSLRVVVMAAIALLIAKSLYSLHPSWAALTCVVVEQNNLLRTIKRVRERVIGSVLGLLVVVGLNLIVPGHTTVLAIALPVVFAITLYFIPRHYIIGTLGVTVCIGMMYYFLPYQFEISANGFIFARALDTVIGVVMALCGYAISRWGFRGVVNKIGANNGKTSK